MCEYDIVIIEDDIYGDIVFEYFRLKLIKFYDEDGCVLLCLLFLKIFVFGFRVGWIVLGKYCSKVIYIKYVISFMCFILL